MTKYFVAQTIPDKILVAKQTFPEKLGRTKKKISYLVLSLTKKTAIDKV